MHLSRFLVVLTTALAITVSAAPLSPTAGSLTKREELYPVQYLGVDDSAEEDKREELYPIEYLDVEDDVEKRGEVEQKEKLYPFEYLCVEDDAI